MKLLLISNSTNKGEEYLGHAQKHIADFLGEKSLHAVFIPYAGITIDYDTYSQTVKGKFAEINHTITSIHQSDDPFKLIEKSDCIVIGGGNTFQLIKLLQDNLLIPAIQKRVNQGIPFIGWSAGANVACPTIRTTNDMPVVQPSSFESLNFIPFQINPHYTDAHPEGHAGETREMRLNEFIAVNREIYVAGLREGTMLKIEDNQIKLIGQKTARIFKYGKTPVELGEKDDLGFLLKG